MKEEYNNQQTHYTYPQPLAPKAAPVPGSIFNRQGGSKFNRRRQPCGPEFVRCDQFRTGRKPLPPNYLAPDYVDVEAVVPVMGNHLVDTTGPEFQKQPFTRSWIYGVYDGKVIFYEAMVARSYLVSKPSGCLPIKAPKAVAVAGFYPTQYCVSHNAATGEYSVSMEKFTRRDASAPEAIPA